MDGAGADRPQWDPAIGMMHQPFAAMETGVPYGIGAYFAYRHDPLTGMPDPEATQRAVDKLKLLVLHRRALLGNRAGSPTSSCPNRPTWSAPTFSAR